MVIGERVREKISASKRKGIWVGGPIPLGYRSINKKLEVIPEEAALVTKIYEDYLRLGSIGALSLSLEREGIKPKPRQLANGGTVAANYFMRGPLGHLLKNRFYIGDVSYQGEIFAGEHPAILERELFDAVQVRMAQQTVQRMVTRSQSPALLTGVIFDDRGNTMSPTHSNKNGIRYRYYVSQALQQRRKVDAGSIARVPASEIEALICNAIRQRMNVDPGIADCNVVREYVHCIVVRANSLELTICINAERKAEDEVPNQILSVPFVPTLPNRKGIAHAPGGQANISAETRDAILHAIARARNWMDSILPGKIASFEDIAALESLGERYVRRLAVLAFLSPKIIRAIVDATAPADLTVSRLTQALPHEWSRQDEMFGIG